VPEPWREKLRVMEERGRYEVLLGRDALNSDEAMAQALIGLSPDLIEVLPQAPLPDRVAATIVEAALTGNDRAERVLVRLAGGSEAARQMMSVVAKLLREATGDRAESLLAGTAGLHRLRSFQTLEFDLDSVRAVCSWLVRRGEVPEP